MTARLPEDHRLYDLMATRAVEGLAPDEEAELARYTAEHPEVDPDAFDRTAASMALVGLRVEPLPAHLRSRAEADAAAWMAKAAEAGDATRAGTEAGSGTGTRTGSESGSVVQLPVRNTRSTAWGGWLAAAAALVVAVVGWLQVDQLADDRAALAARQAALEGSVARLEQDLDRREQVLADLIEPAPEALMAQLEERPDTLALPWSATEDPSAAGAGGEVIWNAAEQAGVMRFSGLQANDPSAWQYQLWIFDAERDDRFPVDGGVFDVGPDGETLVPIRASLPVGQAVLFAITVERPGGVVVSSRERIALVAQPGA